MKSRLPLVLTISRLLFSFIIIIIAFFPFHSAPYVVIGLIYSGIITDILDGILARNLQVSTTFLRRLDTIIDLFFYFSCLYFIYCFNPAPFRENFILIFTILLLEFFMYSSSLLRFSKAPSPHAILSKLWGLYLVIEFTLLLLKVPGYHFTIALVVGILAHTDRLLIYLLLPSWDHDIPSFYHAWLIKQGHSIRRRKLFNG